MVRLVRSGVVPQRGVRLRRRSAAHCNRRSRAAVAALSLTMP